MLLCRGWLVLQLSGSFQLPTARAHELQHLVAPESETCVCELSAPLSSQFPKCDARDSCGMSNLDCQGSGK